MKSVYKNLVSFQNAVQTALEVVTPIDEIEQVVLYDAVGRTLATSIYSPRNNPPFNRATMDGYAVKYASVAEASQTSPVKLKISGESFIGEARKTLSGSEDCFKISTGAIVPSGADAVVRVEDTKEEDGFVEIYESVGQGDNIAESGSDIAMSELLLTGGKELETHDIAVLASLGISNIPVLRKLRIGVISTGNELISFKENYEEGRIYDANGVVVSSELSSFSGIESSYYGIVKDDHDTIKGKIEDALKENDVVILSGGSSAGESDLVYRIIEEYEPGLIFHGVLVKPGLPTVFGMKGHKLLIGLPGFPVSALMIFRSIFLLPLLKAAGSRRIPSITKGKLGVNLRIDMGKQNLIPVSVSNRDHARVYPVTGLSGSITRFTSTSGFISVPGNTKFMESGSDVEIISWNNEIGRAGNVVSGVVVKDISSKYLRQSENWEYRRMLPNDSLKSLGNGDSDLSAFLSTSMKRLEDYVSQKAGHSALTIYMGKNIELVIAGREEVQEFSGDMFSRQSPGFLTGPSLRFLRNIVDQVGTLKDTLIFIEKGLTSYTAVSLEEAASTVSEGKLTIGITTSAYAEKYKLKYRVLSQVFPVFVTMDTIIGKHSELIDVSELEKV